MADVVELIISVERGPAGAGGSGSVVAGNGLTESPAGTFNVGADADGSISVAVDAIKVGVLATDAQHGTRGGGTLHAVATSGAPGFMSAADKAKLDGIEAGATADQTAAEVPFTPNGDIAATNVQAAIVEVRDDTDTKLAAKASTAYVDAGDAATLAAADTAADAGDAATLTSANGYTDTAVAGRALATRQVISGAGLTGGGDLSVDRTLAVGAGTGIQVNADSVEVLYGATATTACVGNDARLSDQRVPTDGSVTATKIASGVITDAHVAAANKDGAAGTACLRTLGTGAQQACAGNDVRLSDARTPSTAGTNGGVMCHAGGVWTSTAAGTSGLPLLSGGSSAPAFGALQTVGTTGATVRHRGGATVQRVATATDYSMAAGDYLIGVTSTTATRTITLLAPASSGGSATDPVVVIVKDESGAASSTNRIVVQVAGGSTIDGASTYEITTAADSRGFYCEGTAWRKL